MFHRGVPRGWIRLRRCGMSRGDGHATIKKDAMKVFISYGSAADQVTALRLQALGAVNGLTVYVPPAYTRQRASML